MPEIQFIRGEFQAFRAVTKLHVGAIQDDLQEGEVIYFDGQTMKRGPDVHQVSTLRSAIKVGWLVPELQEGGSYTAKPAGVQIHDAQATGTDRGEGRQMGSVADEERDLGNRADIRNRAAQQAKAPGAPAPVVSEGAPTGVKVIEEVESLPDGSEGRVVGKFATKAKAEPIQVGKDDARVRRETTKEAPPQVIKKTATGDVDEALSGDDLETILPNAASSGKAAAGIAGEGKTDEEALAAQKEEAAKMAAEQRRKERLASMGTSGATVSVGSTSVGTADDGEVVGKIRPASQAGEEGAAVQAADEGVVDEVPPEAILQAKIEMIQQFVPGFTWDFNLHWRQRVQKAVDLKDNMPVLNAVLSIETDAVKKHTMKAIYG